MKTYVTEDNAGKMYITSDGECFTDFNSPDRPDGAGVEDMIAYHNGEWHGDNEYSVHECASEVVAEINGDGIVTLYPDKMGLAAQYFFAVKSE